MRYAIAALAALMAAITGTGAMAQEPDASRFSNGPVFADFGPVADVEADYAIPDGVALKHSFDVAERAEEGLNPGIVSVARFVNMHARAGVPTDRIATALVVHGRAAQDLLNARGYAERFDGAENPNAALVAALLENGTRIILCGQSAAGLGLDESADLLPGVEVAISAMTAHALLQQQGYSVNPF